MNILIVGLGSIGQRHLRNIKRLYPKTKFYAFRRNFHTPTLNNFNKVQKFIIKHKTPIVIILGLLIIYLSILFSTRNLDHFQDATEDATEDATADATEDACASLRSDLAVLQEEKQSLREQISNLENQITTIEEECDETETKLISEKESLLKSN